MVSPVALDSSALVTIQRQARCALQSPSCAVRPQLDTEKQLSPLGLTFFRNQ